MNTFGYHLKKETVLQSKHQRQHLLLGLVPSTGIPWANSMTTSEALWTCTSLNVTKSITLMRRVAGKGVKQVGSITSAERGQLVTAVYGINAAGSVVPPMLIFPRKNVREHFTKGCIGGANSSGWVNEDLFLDYLNHFIRHTRCSKENRVLLILDNHEAHISLAAIDLAKENGVVLLTMPPHTSHRFNLSMCAVSNLSRRHMLKLWKTGCDQILAKQLRYMKYLNLLPMLSCMASLQKNIMSAFQSTGIFPYNRDLFDETDFSPATVTDRDLPVELERNDPIPAEQLPAPQPEPSSTATPVPQPETDSTATPAQQPEPSSTATPARQPEPSSTATPARQPEPSSTATPARQPEPSSTATPAQQPKPSSTATPARQPEPSSTATPARQPEPSSTATPARQPEPSSTATPARQPKPSSTATPAQQPEPSSTATPAQQPEPSSTATPAQQPEPSSTATPAQQPEPSSTATPARQPKPSSTATPARQPEPSSTATPARQPEPSSTATPARQPEPSSTATPVQQPEPSSTATPAQQPEPSSTATPAQQPEPSSTATPAQLPEPSSTATPAQQPKPSSTATPAQQPEPSSTATPAQQPEPSSTATPAPAQPGPSNHYVSPADIVPLPKAGPQKVTNIGRKRGDTKILTDTPVRNSIADALAARHTKKRKSNQPVKHRAKKSLFKTRARKSPTPSSSSESDTEDVPFMESREHYNRSLALHNNRSLIPVRMRY